MNLSAESHAKVGKPFMSAHNDWQEGTYTCFCEWIPVQYGIELPDSEDEAGLPAQQQRAKDITFVKKNGFRVLPNRAGFTVKDMQRVVRAYIGTCYHKSFKEIVVLRSLC